MNQNQKLTEEPGLFAQLSFRYLPFWPLFLAFLVLGVAGAWAYLKYRVPLYEATATLMVKDEKKGVDDAKLLDALNIYSSTKIVENEIEVVHSRAIMNEVVKQLHLYAPIDENAEFKTKTAYRSSPVVIEVSDPENIKEVTDVHFAVSKTGEVVIGKNAYPRNQWVETPYGRLMFRDNPAKSRAAVYPLSFSLYKLENTTEKYLDRLKVNAASKLSTVINLSIRDEGRQRAKDILTRVLENYTALSISEKNKLAANTLAFVKERIRLVEGELDSMELAIQRFKSQKRVTNLSEEGRLYLHSVDDNGQREAGIKIQMAVLDEIEKYVATRDAKYGILPSTLGVTDPALGEMLQRLRDAEIRYQVLAKTVPENNPLAVSLANEIENLRPGILENVRNQKVALRASRSELASATGSYFAQLQTLPLKERQLFDLNRQQVIINDVYTFLLHKREETALTYASTVADSWVVNQPQYSSIPVSPNPALVYFLAIVLCLAIAVGFVTVKEVLNKKILFRSEIEEATTVPVSAEILLHKGARLIPQDKPSAIAEQFRHLRASIGMYGKNATIKKLLVTSSITGEGKSFVSYNLALSLAYSGKKVLLVDLDLRNPFITQQSQLQGKEGMTDFLNGKVALQDIIRQGQHKNLFVIGSGDPVVNPTELLLSGQLGELFSFGEANFDYLIVDTSPVMPVTDAYIVTEYVDTTLFVIRHKHTPKVLLKSLEKNARLSALTNASIVFNCIRSRGMVVGKYGFGNGYGYEYQYREKKTTGV